MEPNEEKIIETSEFDPGRFFESFIAVGRDLLIRPRIFFNRIPRTGGLKNPFVFLAACSFLASLFMANARGGDYNLFFALFFANTLSAFFGSFLLHAVVSKLFGSPQPFEATFRIIAYTGIMDIVSWIPVVGPIAYFYGLYLVFLGLQEVHRLQPRQAGSAVAAIVLIVTVLLMCLVLVSPESVTQGLRFMDPDMPGGPMVK